jgi:glycosyltransferase involved in cell wall biosynthesis
MQRTEVLFLLNSLGVGGSERKVAGLAHDLHDADVGVSCAYMCKPDALVPQFPSGVPVNFLDRRARLSIRTLRRLVAELRTSGPSVLVAVNIYPALYVATAALLAPRAVIKTVCLLNSGSAQRWRDHWFHGLYLWALRRMDTVVYGSEVQRLQWVSPASTAWSRSCVIYNGVRLEWFAQYAIGMVAAQGRKRWAIPAGRFVFGSVGRLVRVKNYGVLIEALAQLRALQVDAHLLLVGDGLMRTALEQLAAQLCVSEFVTFAGELPDVRPALSIMDVFALPSTDETFSNAALEAMAMARPVILSNVGGAAEMVSHGIEGFLVGAQSTDVDIVQCLLTLCSDSARCALMGQAAQRRVAAQFSASAMFDQYRRVLSSERLSPTLDS